MEIVGNIGHNWFSLNDDSKERMITLVEEIHKAGADSVCFKMFKADEVYRDSVNIDATSAYDIPENILTAGVNNAKRLGLRVYITPQYLDAVPFSESVLKPYGYRVENGDLRYEQLMLDIGNTDKPVIIPTALYAFGEMEEPLAAYFNPDKVTLLHATGGMPTLPRDAKISTALDMAAHFMKQDITKWGLESTYVSLGLDSVTMGYMLDMLVRTIDLDDRKGIEATWSKTPEELATLVELDQIISQALNPEFVYENLTQTDWNTRERYLRGTDNLLPCNCGEGNTDT